MTATATATHPASVRIDDSRLRIFAPEAFGVGRHRHARRFARRVMALPEIQGLSIDPARGEAWLRYRVAADERPAWLQRLATAVAGDGTLLDEAALPAWPDGSEVALSRCGDAITTLRIIEAGTDTLRVAPGAGTPLQRSDGLQTARALETRHGIVAAEVEGTEAVATLRVRFDAARIDRGGALGTIEEELAAGRLRHAMPEPAPVDFGLSNTTLGLSTVGEVIVPAVTPLAAGILVANKLGVIRDAAADLSRGKIGVPLFDTALLTCSIVTGQVLAYALTDWSLRFWQQRWRRQLASETRRFASEDLPLPALAECVESDTGRAHPVSLTQIRPGHRVKAVAGNRIPVDGRVVAGIALVDGFPGCAPGLPTRRTVGDEVLAGCLVRAGEVVLEARRIGPHTRAGTLAAALREAAITLPRERGLQRKSEQLAERSVVPTLATAGVGWAAGDLITVGAILHQDWISGPGLAVPLLTMKQIRETLAAGVLVRNPSTFQRLAESRFIVIDGDEPSLAAPVLELAKLESHVAELDEVLRQAAAAALYLGDERSSALADACRARGLIVRQSPVEEIEAGRVSVRSGNHRVRLIDDPADGIRTPDMLLEIDSHTVARLGFRTGDRFRAADAVQRLRTAGLQTGVIASASDHWTAALGQGLGADLAGGELTGQGKLRFLEGLRRRGLHPTYVGPLQAHPELAAAAHVAIDTGGLGGNTALADAVLIAGHYGAVADLAERSRAHEPAIRSSTRMATIPNLLCVTGAFAGLLNGITAGLIANLGVMAVDRELRRRLQANRPGAH